MKDTNYQIYLLLFGSIFWLGNLNAQSSFNALGGDIENESGSIAYSFAQPFSAVVSASNGSVEVGTQHAYAVIPTNSTQLEPEISIRVFPNPASDYISVVFDESLLKTYELTLVDLNGNTLSNSRLEGMEKQIDMTDLAPGTYILNIISTDKSSSKNFKIIKY